MKKILLLLLITTASYSQTLLKLRAIEYAPAAGYCIITNSLGVQTYTPCSSLTNTTGSLTSPTLTGVPIAPTAAVNTNNTQVATTAYADRKISSASIAINHGSVNFADATSYFTGQVYVAPTTATAISRRFFAPINFTSVDIYASCFSTAATSSENVVLKINNKTTALGVTAGNISYNNVTINYTFTGNSLSGTKGDQLELQIDIPTLATNGSGSIGGFTIVFNR